MSEPLQERIAHAMAELEATRAAVSRAQADLSQAAATVRSKDRVVEATVGSQGELTGLKFLDNKHQSMTGPQLAASVMEAVQQGRSQMAHRVMETFAPFTQPGPEGSVRRGLDIDWNSIFGSALSGEGRTGSGRSGRNRLRDEIAEDDESAG
ncbi:YbaB/EbfC family nucleoid-associated protein [Streptomyces tubbatahanensis]|uniref:YbaB/EbfC family nucleoid-associated protein n=1 Tax=Streptomyces tubbatahanensis TaxID=2923272 RepID=A0ABY3XZH3_9ACTN|nr:YbaB/EbfC family nucleoid-associated protein [Streptomyces tubbatahanensis]UNS99673.1 YbaB/EbfC family nucleoid-associated protein [Streptomyces tubbatahanensis]